MEKFLSWLTRMISPTSTGSRESLDDDEVVWDQNVRTVLAIVVVIVSAFIIYWIMN